VLVLTKWAAGSSKVELLPTFTYGSSSKAVRLAAETFKEDSRRM
jgi:hypothetical protein